MNSLPPSGPPSGSPGSSHLRVFRRGSRVVRDLGVAFVFLTRIPIRIAGDVTGADIARASRHYPVVGACVGAILGAIAWLGLQVFPATLAATLACVAGLLLTGAFHEDALADVADGFGGGFTVERKLAIMKDSLHGTYGVLALLTAMLVRVQAIAWFDSRAVLPALLATHALSRVGPVWLMRLLPVARAEGLGAEAGRVGWAEPLLALLLGTLIAVFALGPTLACFAVPVAAIATMGVGWLTLNQVRGITGDVLGTAQQVSELAVMLLIGALLVHAPAMRGGFAGFGGG